MSNKVEGRPCKRCGCTLRYLGKGRMGPCVECVANDKAKRLARYHERREQNQFNLEYRLNQFVIETRRRSKAKGYCFDLDFEYLKSIWTGTCPLSGEVLDLKFAESGPNPKGPSLDRIVPEKGYVKGNVRFVTYHVNTALSCFGEEALVELAKNLLRTHNE